MKELQGLWEMYDFWERQAGYIKNNKIEQIKLKIRKCNLCKFIKAGKSVQSKYEIQVCGHSIDLRLNLKVIFVISLYICVNWKFHQRWLLGWCEAIVHECATHTLHTFFSFVRHHWKKERVFISCSVKWWLQYLVVQVDITWEYSQARGPRTFSWYLFYTTCGCFLHEIIAFLMKFC